MYPIATRPVANAQSVTDLCEGCGDYKWKYKRDTHMLSLWQFFSMDGMYITITKIYVFTTSLILHLSYSVRN